MKKHHVFTGTILLLAMLATSACVSSKLEKAFSGGLEAEESDKLISEYCVTCHVHKSFDPETHVFNVKYRYEDKKYAGKTECRICHTYSKTLLLDIRRGTHRPAES